MSLPQIVRAASAGSISWLQAAGYQAFKGKVLPLAMALLPTTRGSRRVSRDFGPWAPAPQAQTIAKLGQDSSGCGPRDPLASRRHIAGASVRLYRRAGLEKRNSKIPPEGSGDQNLRFTPPVIAFEVSEVRVSRCNEM